MHECTYSLICPHNALVSHLICLYAGSGLVIFLVVYISEPEKYFAKLYQYSEQEPVSELV